MILKTSGAARRHPLLLLPAAVFFLHPLIAEAAPQADANLPALHIVVLEGDGVMNSIQHSVPHEVAVRVEDQNKRPVAGAAVTFQLPSAGPSGRFRDDGTIAITTTDLHGEARASGLRPNNVQGDFQIKVTASYQGKTAGTTLTQTNVLAINASQGSFLSTRVVLILAGIGGAAALAVLGATHSGKSSSTSGSSPAVAPAGITITPGTPAVAGPH